MIRRNLRKGDEVFYRARRCRVMGWAWTKWRVVLLMPSGSIEVAHAPDLYEVPTYRSAWVRR